MSTKKQSAYLMDVSVGDYYRDLDAWLKRFSHMNLVRWKILKNVGISLLVAYLAVEAGADANVALAVIALVNGISFADLAAVWGVSVELKGEGPTVQREEKTQQDDNADPDRETETERR